MGWARLTMMYEKSQLPAHGSDEELPMLLYVMERNHMYQALVELFATVMAGGDKAQAIKNHVSELFHTSDPEELNRRLETRRKVFEAWTRADPFRAQRLPTPDELIKKAHQQSVTKSSMERMAQLTMLRDSLVPGGML